MAYIKRKISEEEERGGFSKVFNSLGDLLEYKNQRYGAAYKAEGIFGSGIEPETHLFTRINEKLARIKNSTELRKNDVVDLTSYLIILLEEKGWNDFSEFKD